MSRKISVTITKPPQITWTLGDRKVIFQSSRFIQYSKTIQMIYIDLLNFLHSQPIEVSERLMDTLEDSKDWIVTQSKLRDINSTEFVDAFVGKLDAIMSCFSERDVDRWLDKTNYEIVPKLNKSHDPELVERGTIIPERTFTIQEYRDTLITSIIGKAIIGPLSVYVFLYKDIMSSVDDNVATIILKTKLINELKGGKVCFRVGQYIVNAGFKNAAIRSKYVEYSGLPYQRGPEVIPAILIVKKILLTSILADTDVNDIAKLYCLTLSTKLNPTKQPGDTVNNSTLQAGEEQGTTVSSFKHAVGELKDVPCDLRLLTEKMFIDRRDVVVSLMEYLDLPEEAIPTVKRSITLAKQLAIEGVEEHSVYLTGLICDDIESGRLLETIEDIQGVTLKFVPMAHAWAVWNKYDKLADVIMSTSKGKNYSRNKSCKVSTNTKERLELEYEDSVDIVEDIVITFVEEMIDTELTTIEEDGSLSILKDKDIAEEIFKLILKGDKYE